MWGSYRTFYEEVLEEARVVPIAMVIIYEKAEDGMVRARRDDTEIIREVSE